MEEKTICVCVSNKSIGPIYSHKSAYNINAMKRKDCVKRLVLVCSELGG